MKLNVKLEINPGMRFKNSMLKARGEFQKSGLKRKDLKNVLAEVRGKKSQ
jgi:hypothetical protein